MTGTMPRVYFYCRNDAGNLQEDVIALAEGLRELGVPYHASCDYWQEDVDGPHLLRHDPQVTPDDCDVVVVSYTWPYWIRMKTFDLVRRPLPAHLFRKGRRYRTVYMDHHDGHRTVSWEPEFRQFDVILRAKLNRRAWHPANLQPWALGLTRRVLRETAAALPFAARRRALLVNFGASHPYPHGTRTLARRLFEPRMAQYFTVDRTMDDLSREPHGAYDRLMWRQTGGRHARAYYERLNGSRAVSCFCGELIAPAPFAGPERYLVGGRRAQLRRAAYEVLARVDPRPRRAVQWDSFRFWEALAAGCLAFNVDLERYGVALPTMPRNWVHYMGVDFARVHDVIERLHDEPDCMPRIADAGRAWALEHYSPARVAARLLAAAGVTVPVTPTAAGACT